MLSSLKRFWNDHPLFCLMLIALVPRLIAAVFAKGYGMHDDHFGPIEQPHLIMKDVEYWTSRNAPHGHSIVYPAIHYILFNVLQWLGVFDPQAKMYVVRFLHALYSLLIVWFGFKIADRLSDRETAKKTGLLLALFWAFPYLGVRNLIETVCIPPLMAGFFYLLRSDDKRKFAFYAGLCFGFAFIFRYQTIILPGMAGLLLLYQKKIRDTAVLAAGFVATAVLVQGSADLFAWGYPFAAVIEYFKYNATHARDYTTGPWYNYTLLILGALIPPTSFLLGYGYFRRWRKTLLLFVPVLVFIIVHSSFPNKQERFILPIIPLVLLLGTVGWETFRKDSPFWFRHKALLKGLWVWFWTVNVVLLVLFSTYYGKQSRVEAMYSLYGKPVTGMILVGGRIGTSQMPLFYGNVSRWDIYEVMTDEDIGRTASDIAASPHKPNYVLFFGDEDLQQRIERVQKGMGVSLAFEARKEPSMLDVAFYRLNPKHNKNEVMFVYHIER